MNIRRATLLDNEHIAHLMVELYAEMEQFGADELCDNPLAAARSYVESHLLDFRCAFFVADDGGVLVGYVLGSLRKRIEIFAVRDYGHVNDIYVRIAYRKKGVARKLMDELEFFFEGKAVFVDLQVRSLNDAALALYSQLDYQEYAKKIKKKLRFIDSGRSF